MSRLLQIGSALAMLGVSVAAAAPAPGASLPTVVLEDLREHKRTLVPSVVPLPLVIVLEDDTSAKHKQAAHAVVGRYSDNKDNHAVFELLAIADMDHWNWWPARKHALAAMRKIISGEGSGVWIDWTGTLRKAMGLHKAESSFLVVGTDGRIRYFAQGELDRPAMKALDDAIAALGAKPVPGR